MTIEQNQPQPPSTPAMAQGQSQGQGHRRRRRRRKGFVNGQDKGHGNDGGQPIQGKRSAKSKPNQNRFGGKHANGHGNGNGNGGSQGGGGRRRNKKRRQQTFVGPMDHSYRAVNGNVADAPPSTIELRGNGQNASYADTLVPDPAATPVRENAPTRIYCFIEDLFFLAKIQETARKLGVKVGFVKADKDIVSRLADAPDGERPSLIVFDLNNVGAKPLTLIPRLKSKMKRGTSVIGFLNHLQGDLKAKAVEAGCDMVMPRSAFSQNLPSLLRRHGFEEEPEAVEA
jgi:CheY-like chemotaxis protein